MLKQSAPLSPRAIALAAPADAPAKAFGLLSVAVIMLAAALLVVALSSAHAAVPKKIALVIGNGAYKGTVALTNPVQDARAMAEKLSRLGFDVISGYDEDRVTMQKTVSDFARQAVGADIALMFYAGHGIQVHGDNYLIPVDAKFEDETALDFETIPVNFIIRQMSRDVRVRVIILDACRNNPLARSLARAMGPSRGVSVSEGLAEIKIEDPGEGTVIAFATSPGDVAYDGDSRHSPFTTALLDHIDTPDTPIQNVMTSVTRDVYLATKERQRPWVNASLISEVYLNPTAAAAQVASAETGTDPATSEPGSALPGARPSDEASIAWDREKILFQSAEKSGAVEDYQAYLAAYPQGQFASIARNYVARAANNATTADNAAPADNPATVAATATAAPLTVAALPQADMTRTSAASAEMPASSEMAAPPTASAPQTGTSIGEAALGWDQPKRREVQTRLELTGREVGSIDGSFGARTRTAVGDWQRENGFDATGFFTAEQFQLLVTQTDEAYKRQTEAAQTPTKPRRDSAATRDKASAGVKEKTRGKTTAKAKKPASSDQAQSKRRTNQAQTQEPPATTPKKQRAGQVGIEFGYGRGGTIYSDDPCLTHPGHRIINGMCIY